jgi:protein-arginine kinase activator protein McsA
MSNNSKKCPQCHLPALVEQFTVIRRQTCPNCHFIDQSRVTPIVRGGLAMITYLTDYMIEHNGHLGGLETALQQQLAKVQRHHAKHRNRGNGGSPPRAED